MQIAFYGEITEVPSASQKLPDILVVHFFSLQEGFCEVKFIGQGKIPNHRNRYGEGYCAECSVRNA